jgi:hypothetical protein
VPSLIFLVCSGGAADGIVDIYDTKTRKWTAGQLSKKRMLTCAAGARNIAIFGGGLRYRSVPKYSLTSHFSTNPRVWYDTADIYDADTNAWSVATLSVPRFHHVAVSTADHILFAGGLDPYACCVLAHTYYVVREERPTSSVDIYDTHSGTWSYTDLEHARFEFAATSVGQKVIFAGGCNKEYAALSWYCCFDV